ncbi:aspartyl/asparaginyl beta-hydroxylase domain-containing protein [Thermomonospora cellulosilytica]|uniref:Aspartyl/asparaginy/proline hydroxylase domain-containing protein n=1 Tax=Thermomonospora cellulosilytica TaxID=1411118 RepID=A0A7W3RC05_9ACTN|nr:aspartyl/asparaginyl beta-hydroxylase domain-containing protein [Thermomonospora cellulosilytica]MBA9007933.1 hypothetical protein [Thermomonospora cellulosilytica]
MSTYPASTPMALDFDVAKLQADLDALRRERWRAQRPIGRDGLLPEPDVDWRVLPLRSIGGDPERTDPGGAGLDDFADTPWLDKAPHLREVIDAIPAPVRGVRLMSLGSGATVHEHRDSRYGFPNGLLRLHVPIDTNPDAVVVIDRVPRHWDAGRLWFGDFRRPHYVANHGDRARVHMVIDCLVGHRLIDLFPAGFRERLPLSEVLFAREPVPLVDGELDAFRCRFALPGEFPQWSEDEAADGPDAEAAIEIADGRPVLGIDGRPAFGLVHLGLGEFRLTGWSEERTITVEPGGSVRIRIRAGRRMREWIRPTRP